MKTNRIISIFAATILALTMAGCAGTGEYFDDTVITTKVKSALINDPALRDASVNVETFKGAVQLSGFVKTAAERDQAVKTTRAVAGVKQVRNDILLR